MCFYNKGRIATLDLNDYSKINQDHVPSLAFCDMFFLFLKTPFTLLQFHMGKNHSCLCAPLLCFSMNYSSLLTLLVKRWIIAWKLLDCTDNISVLVRGLSMRVLMFWHPWGKSLSSPCTNLVHRVTMVSSIRNLHLKHSASNSQC